MDKLLQLGERIEKKYAELIMYFVLIPFLHPRGFDAVWQWHKSLFTLWLLPAMLVIFLWVVFDLVKRGQTYQMSAFAMGIYYVLFIGITLILQGSLREGLQKLIAAPALYLFTILCLRQDGRRFLRVMGNILFWVMVANISVFCPPVVDAITRMYHVNFLGHVQVSAMFGILGIVIAVLQIALGEDRIRPLLLIGLCLLTMIWSGTAASQLMITVLVLGVVMWLIPGVRRCLLLEQKWYLAAYFAINLLLMLFALGNHYVIAGINLSISGRTHVWSEALRSIAKNPLLGYGAYGVLIQPSWSATATNYAHNELLQRFLDGGIVLTVVFYWMVYLFLKPVSKLRSPMAKALANTCIVAVLLLMTFESVTDYYYISIFMVLMSQLPKLINPKKTRGRRLQ